MHDLHFSYQDGLLKPVHIRAIPKDGSMKRYRYSKPDLSRLDMKTRGNQVMINNPCVWPAEPVTGFANTKHISL